MKKMADLELCAAISDAFGPSGYETEAVDVIESSLGGLAAHRDSMQNLYVSLPQNVGGRPLVMLDAHTDEVGFMVQSITATGLLRIVPLGGWVEPVGLKKILVTFRISMEKPPFRTIRDFFGCNICNKAGLQGRQGTSLWGRTTRCRQHRWRVQRKAYKPALRVCRGK